MEKVYNIGEFEVGIYSSHYGLSFINSRNVCSIYNALGIEWNSRYEFLEKEGFALYDKNGHSPQFKDKQECIRFIQWADHRLRMKKTLMFPDEPDIVHLHNEKWRVRNLPEDQWYLTCYTASHSLACKKLFEAIGIREEGFDRTCILRERGWDCYYGIFPVFSTKEELFKFINNLKQQLNEVSGEITTDRTGSERKPAYLPSKPSTVAIGARPFGNPAKVGRVKGTIVNSKSNISPAYI